MSSAAFLQMGNRYTKTKFSASKKFSRRRFKSFFGITPEVCSIVWEKVKLDAPSNSEPKHLLWCLNFLKQYQVEHARHALFGASEKTIRHWTWIFVQLLSDLDIIQWEARFVGALTGQSCFCSIDGIDFKVLEPKPFNQGWYSHKFRSAGLRYEIGLNIRTGSIVWKNGGYPCGRYPDLKLEREAFVPAMEPGEKSMADLGYKDINYFILPSEDNGRLHKVIMSRHETVNKRLRQWNILKHTYRHTLNLHPSIFHAVVNLTEIQMQNGEPLFQISI